MRYNLLSEMDKTINFREIENTFRPADYDELYKSTCIIVLLRISFSDWLHSVVDSEYIVAPK